MNLYRFPNPATSVCRYVIIAEKQGMDDVRYDHFFGDGRR